MRKILTVILSITSLVSLAQGQKREIRVPEIGWTVTMPDDAKSLTQYQLDTLNRKTITALNNAYGIGDSAFKDLTQLFAIRKGRWNNLASTLNIYDSTLFPTWQESYTVSKQMLVDLMGKQGSQVKILDTASSTEVIDGLIFERFYLKTFYPGANLTLNTYWYCRKQGRYDFSITLSYAEDEVGKELLELIRRSRFDH